MKATPIPDDESLWMRSFSEMQKKNELLLRDILERCRPRTKRAECTAT